MRKIALVLSVLVLLITGVLGVYNGVTEPRQAEDALQLSVACGVLAYGILGLLAASGLLLRKRWTFAVAAVWGVMVTYVSSLAPIAYGPDDVTIIGAVAGGVGTALIAAGVLWTVRRQIPKNPAKRDDSRAGER